MTDMRIGGPGQPIVQPEIGDAKGAQKGQTPAALYHPEAAPKDYAVGDRPGGAHRYANLDADELRELVEKLLLEYALGQIVRTIAEGTDAAVVKAESSEQVGDIAAKATSAPGAAVIAYLTVAGVDSAIVDTLAGSLVGVGGRPLDELLHDAQMALDRLAIPPALDDILNQVTGLQGPLGEAVRVSLTLLAYQVERPGQIDADTLAIASGTLQAAAAELVIHDPEAARALASVLTHRLGGGIVALTAAEAALRHRVEA